MHPLRFATLKARLQKSSGFTLVEVLVVTAMATTTIGMIGGAIFQSLSTHKAWRGEVVAVKELRHAESWFARDALNAEAIDLGSGSQPADFVELRWTDGEDVEHLSVYSVSGSSLLRTFDGVSLAVARRVVSVGFSLSGTLLVFDLEVATADGGTISATTRTFPRMLN